MNCCAVLTKFILCLFSKVLMVCGILVFVVGAIMCAHLLEYPTLTHSIQSNLFPITIALLGGLIFLVSLVGFCGTVRERSSCVLTFCFGILLLFFIQLALILYIVFARKEFLNYVNKTVRKIWNERNANKLSLNIMQSTFDCCGVKSYHDYEYMRELIPPSCCGHHYISCTPAEAQNRPGCSKSVGSFSTNNFDMIVYIAALVAAIELIAFLLSCCYLRNLRNERRRVRQQLRHDTLRRTIGTQPSNNQCPRSAYRQAQYHQYAPTAPVHTFYMCRPSAPPTQEIAIHSCPCRNLPV